MHVHCWITISYVTCDDIIAQVFLIDQYFYFYMCRPWNVDYYFANRPDQNSSRLLVQQKNKLPSPNLHFRIFK